MIGSLHVELPPWIDGFLADQPDVFKDSAARVGLAIALARRNIEEGTGGPFGSAIFDVETGHVISVGVNMVVPSDCAVLHAEVVAILFAGPAVGHFDLGAAHLPEAELATSTEPCAMCFGAVTWSGVTRVTSAATDADAREVGFDEGPKMDDWAASLEARGITVQEEVEREMARAVLRDYAVSGGLIYNGRTGRFE